MRNNLLKNKPYTLPVYTESKMEIKPEPIIVWKEQITPAPDTYITINDLNNYLINNDKRLIHIEGEGETFNGQYFNINGLPLENIHIGDIKGIRDCTLYYMQNIPSRNSNLYKRLQKSVCDRDGHKCVLCGSTVDLTVHHISPFKNQDWGCYSLDNCITLCRDCHNKYHKYSGVDDVGAYNWTRWLLETKCNKGLYRGYDDYERITGLKQGE